MAGKRDGKTAYSEKLKDPRWQQLRLRVFERHKFTCLGCEETTRTLAVHHRYYERGREPWDYPLEAFSTLCEDCHDTEYQLRQEVEGSLILALKKSGLLVPDLHYLATVFAPAFTSNPGRLFSIMDTLTAVVRHPEFDKRLWDFVFELVTAGHPESPTTP